MSKQKKLTLQEYIQSQNTRRKLSKEKILSNSTSKPMLEAKKHVNQNSKQVSYLGFPEELTESMHTQIDRILKKVELSLWEFINQIKHECRDFIRNDKNFDHFNRLMDQLMHKYKLGISQIQKERLSILRMTKRQHKENTIDLLKLDREKSSHQYWHSNKSENETNQTITFPKTIKDQMTEQKKGEEFIRLILQGSTQSLPSQKKPLFFKKYSSQNLNELQNSQKNKPAFNFLNFIVKKVQEVKKSKLNQNIQLSISGDSLILSNQFNQLNISSSNDKNHQNCQKNLGTKKLSIEASKLVESIYILSSNEKVNMQIQTDAINNLYETHNFSFGFKSSQIGEFSSLKQSLESPRFPQLKTSPSTPDYLTQIQKKIPIVKIQRQKSPPLPSHRNLQPKNDIQNKHPISRPNHIIQRANQRSESKPIKYSVQKKVK